MFIKIYLILFYFVMTIIIFKNMYSKFKEDNKDFYKN